MSRLARWFEVLTVADRVMKVWGRYTAPSCWRQGFAALLAVGLLMGCGQSGPLTLPTRDVEAATAPAAEEQVADEEQESEEDEE